LMDQYTQAELDQILLAPPGGVTVQDPGNVVGTGTNAWSYLVMEGESYVSETDDSPGVGFTKVYADGAITSSLGNPVLGTNTTASKKGALFTQTAFGLHIDKVTYQVQFATPGTYYLYMRFTMFDNAGGNGNYLSEDSFFLPPDFDKDPQTDWPLTDPANGRNGGYTEGCCSGAGFLYIPEVGGGGIRVDHTTDTNEWEGIFHWNDLLSSQFLAPELSGEPGVRHKYEVTPSMVGHPLNFTVSYREGGVTVDLFLFSTHTNLMDQYTQAELDQILLTSGSNPPPPLPKLSVSLVGKNVVVSWPASASNFVLESASTLSPPNWAPDTSSAVVVVGDQATVTIVAASGTKFYRLRKP